MYLRKIPAQAWLLLLCAGWFYLPLDSIFYFETRFEWLQITLFLQWAFVMSCYILSRSRWCAAIILIEVFCMICNTATCYAPDALRDSFYATRPFIVQIAFILQLLAIAIGTGGGVGSHNNNNRRKSDPSNNSDSDLNRSQPVFGSAGMVEAQK